MYYILTKDLNEEMREFSMFAVSIHFNLRTIKKEIYNVFEAVNVDEKILIETFEQKEFESLFIEVSEENFKKYKDLVENANFEDAEDLSISLVEAHNKK